LPFLSSALINCRLLLSKFIELFCSFLIRQAYLSNKSKLDFKPLGARASTRGFSFLLLSWFPPLATPHAWPQCSQLAGRPTHQAHARAARAPQQYYYSRLPRCTLTIFFQRNTSSPFFSFAFSVKKQQLRTNSQQFDEIFWTVKRRCAKNFVLCISCLPPKG
jgi:hypothetical protein